MESSARTSDQETSHCTAFEGARCIGSGELAQVALEVKKVVDRGPRGPVLVFDDTTSEQIELDLRGSPDDVSRRLARPAAPPPAEVPRGPGRPKLGVVAREVTLLPRHWAWLGTQPGGASVTLRRLVEEARRANADKDRLRQGQEATYRFMSVMAGDRPGFEEATRALFASQPDRFDQLVAAWPVDVRDHVRKLAVTAMRPPAK
jgi:hypothetical protein